MHTVAILGCAGYAGQETLDRVLAHPELSIVALGSDSLAGREAAALDPRLNGALPAFTSNAEAAAAGADVFFLCLDNAEAAACDRPAPPRTRDRADARLSGLLRTPPPARAARPARDVLRADRRRRPRAAGRGVRGQLRRPDPPRRDVPRARARPGDRRGGACRLH